MAKVNTNAGEEPKIVYVTDHADYGDQSKMGEVYKDMGLSLEKMFSKTLEQFNSGLTSAFNEMAKSLSAGKQADLSDRRGAADNAYLALKQQAEEKGDDKTLKELEKRKQLQDIQFAKEERALRNEDRELDRQLAKEQKDNLKDALMNGSFKDIKETFTDGKSGMDGFKAALKNTASVLGDFAKSLASTISTIGQYKTAWDTRLHGATFKNHYTMTELVKTAVGVSPFIKQSAVMQNLDQAISSGIAYNVEQRAYLQTLSDSIATTFDAFSENMNKLIRIQQADSTASRLGMEASLNEFLNNQFMNTEYLNGLRDSVTGALYEATSLMDSKSSIGFEYQVQKWLGSLYSVGMSSDAVTSIAGALGQLASGDTSGTDSGAGKLLVMAAANAGLDYAQMLTDGFDNSDINVLLESVVNYLQSIASDNKVVQTQMANVFGMKTSDIIASTNLNSSDMSSIYGEGKNYSNTSAQLELIKMMGTIGTRYSMAGMLSNLTENLSYTMSAGIADNPALYTIYTMGTMLDQLANGGMELPFINAMGFGVDLNSSIADLMLGGSMMASIMSGAGGMLSGLAQMGLGVLPSYALFSATSQGSLRDVGGRGLSTVSAQGGTTSSEVQGTYHGNSSSDDITSSTMSDASDQKAEAAAGSEDEEKKIGDVWEINSQILQIMQDLVSGDEVITVRTYNPLGNGLVDKLWDSGEE